MLKFGASLGGQWCTWDEPTYFMLFHCIQTGPVRAPCKRLLIGVVQCSYMQLKSFVSTTLSYKCSILGGHAQHCWTVDSVLSYSHDFSLLSAPARARPPTRPCPPRVLALQPAGKRQVPVRYWQAVQITLYYKICWDIMTAACAARIPAQCSIYVADQRCQAAIQHLEAPSLMVHQPF